MTVCFNKLLVVTLLLTMGFASPVVAAEDSPKGADAFSSTLTIFFVSLGVGVSTGALVGYLSGASVDDMRKTEVDKAQLERRQRLLEAYLLRDGSGLDAELAVGAGDRVNDVAQLCGVSHDELSGFGRRLRGQRVQLLGLIQRPQDFTRTQLWSKLCV